MFTLINENLFNLKNSVSKNAYGTMYQTDVMTSNEITPPVSSRFNTPTRQLLRIFSKTSDYNALNHLVNIKTLPSGSNSVSIKADPNNRYDAHVMALAFPFNGVVRPLEPCKQYRIHRGMILSSSHPNVQNDGHKYKNVLYLLIEPHFNLFAPDHAYHTPEIRIALESYEDCRDQNVPNFDTLSSCEKMTVVITKDDVRVEWERENVPYVSTADLRKQQLFTVFVPEDKTEKEHEATTPSAVNTASAPNRAATYTDKLTGVSPDRPAFKPYTSPTGPSDKFRGGGYTKDRYDDEPPRQKKTGNRGKKSRKGR